MRKQLEETVFSKYSDFFKKDSQLGTNLVKERGFEHGDGWYGILETMLSDMLKVSRKDVEKTNKVYDVNILQIKEKFGRLTVYARVPDLIRQDITNIIEIAENISTETCEVCGNPGEINNIGRILNISCELHNPIRGRKGKRRRRK